MRESERFNPENPPVHDIDGTGTASNVSSELEAVDSAMQVESQGGFTTFSKEQITALSALKAAKRRQRAKRRAQLLQSSIGTYQIPDSTSGFRYY